MFQLKSPKELEGEVKNWFQGGGYSGHFGFQISMILAIFSSTCEPVVSTKFALWFARCSKQTFKMAVVVAILDFGLKQF